MKKFAKSVSTVSLLTATAMLLAVTKYEDVQGSSLENDIFPVATVKISTLETSGQEKIIFASAIETDVEEETENTTNSDEMYSNTVYCVGEDIPADSYVITCTNTDYSMEVVVFSDETEYDDFLKAEKNTVGKYRNALEAYAWTNYYLYEDEQIYVNLKKGNILLLDDGMCEFSRYTTETSSILYSGLYIAGEDIVCEKMNIKCTSDYLTVTVFDNTEDYLAYHKTDRFTVGEESDAIAEYSASNDFIYNDYSTYVNLQEGMILMVEDGTGEYSVDAGPVIN
ncbi:MAG: hypothetical protein LIP12_13925 [Clostridiales bacterium]|nr:hypothetical protein [Clostridiales bacterium]